jgi:ribosomal-protein-alanine N-acetyltransferase
LHAAAFRDDRHWSEREISDLLNGAGLHLLETDQGFVILRIVADEAEILTLAVHPSAQRSGQGTALVLQCLTLAQQHGASRVFLEVAPDNTAALALYAHQGFAQTGRRKAYYRRAQGAPVDALLLQVALTKGHITE